jgi:dihydropteroate synthase
MDRSDLASRRVFVYGVVNVSPDSKQRDSIVATPEEAVARATMLLEHGADGLDVGGQGSTDEATVVDWTVEWTRLEPIVPALAALGVSLSIDSWRPQVVRQALAAGATMINAADGMQHDAMWEVAAEFDVPIVVPFLSGPNPRQLAYIRRDPLDAIIEFFESRLADADRYGVRDRCIIDPGTGFAPAGAEWNERYRYQKQVYSNIGALRRFGLPLYVALPWKESPQHEELLELVIAQGLDYGRSHRPWQVREVEDRLSGQSGPRGRTPAGGRDVSQPGGQRSGATSASGASTNRR